MKNLHKLLKGEHVLLISVLRKTDLAQRVKQVNKW
jgi:hypothetical protein